MDPNETQRLNNITKAIADNDAILEVTKFTDGNAGWLVVEAIIRIPNTSILNPNEKQTKEGQ